MKISLGLNRKRYVHKMDFHVNTTSSFGFCQPFMSQFLSQGDKLKVNDFRQLVRNGLMPSPTFGQIKCENRFYFVPISEIFPNYDVLLSGIPVSRKGVQKIKSAPYVIQSDLVGCLLSPYFSEYRIMKNVMRNADTYADYRDSYVDSPSSVFLDVVSSTGFDDTSLKDFYNSYLSIETPKQSNFNVGSYDYALYSPSSPSGNLCCFFKLNKAGRNLYTILRGLGYSLSIDDNSKVSILPLLAYYKAYVDSFVNKNSYSWPNSVGFELVNEIANVGSEHVSFGNGGYATLMRKLFLEMADFYYTHSDDYVSMNKLNPVGDVTDLSTVFDVDNVPRNRVGDSLPDLIDSNMSQAGSGSAIPAINSVVSQIDLDTLKRLTHFVNKNSIVGKKLSEWIKVHYGETVANELFSDSRSVATLVTDVRLDDIYSNSDTETSSEGSALGERAGLGQGFSSNNSFDFTAPSPGFLIGFFSIYPVSSYVDGNDPQLHMLDRYSFPSSEWDALGFELTPLDVFYNNNVFLKSQKYIGDKAFGFVPRLSNLKFKKSVLNGAMAIRSTRDFLASYHLDNIVKRNELGMIPLNEQNNFDNSLLNVWLKNNGYYVGKLNFAGKLTHYDEKVLSDPFNYNYVGKYGNVGNYDRIFAHPDTDNFIVQMAVDMNVSNKLKPLSQSFETYDNTHDNDSVDIDNRS